MPELKALTDLADLVIMKGLIQLFQLEINYKNKKRGSLGLFFMYKKA